MLCLPLIAEVISTADWQLCCAEKLVQLDSEYCDLLPDLYKNIPQGWFYQTNFFIRINHVVNLQKKVIEVEASCSTGFRGHTCAAPAKVPVEIEVRSKMNEIGNILAHNRQQYLAIRTSWVAPTRWNRRVFYCNDLCPFSLVSSFLFENTNKVLERRPSGWITWLISWKRHSGQQFWKKTDKRLKLRERRCSTLWLVPYRLLWRHSAPVHELL